MSGVGAEPAAAAAVPPAEAFAAIEKICRSRVFERSERLQGFFRYVCERTLSGESSRINEYLIATEVFHRGTDYSSGDDSIVRRQAHALRQKLQQYYADEGRQDSIRIDLPVGRYVPVFRRNGTAPAAQSAPVTAATPVSEKRNRIAVRVAAAIAIVLVFAAGWMFGQRSLRDGSDFAGVDPAVSEIWGPWLSDRTTTFICFSNPLTTIVKHYSALPAGFAPSPRPLEGADEQLLRQAFALPSGGKLYWWPSLSQTKMGDAISGAHLGALLGRGKVPVRAIQSRFVTWDLLRHQNVVLLGHDEANRWMDPLLERYPLRLTPTSGEYNRGILNTAATGGERARFEVEYPASGSGTTVEYALVSMLPGLGPNRRLLLVSGLNTQATQMAAEFLTDSESLRELLKQLRLRAPGHRGAWHFQAVVRTEVRDKVPTRASLVLLRVL